MAGFNGDRRTLAQLLTRLENDELEEPETPDSDGIDRARSYVVGLTGAPGVGKSTLTDALIAELRAGGQTVAVLAVDPSSPYSGGALLGDRVRMTRHAADSGVYIRSLANRGHVGGLSRVVPRAIRLLDGFGFDWTLVETVGVGQAEIEVAATADTTLVVTSPGLGDQIQAEKAGLMEIADVFVVNKSDRPGADTTARDLRTMINIGGRRSGWRPSIVKTTGIGGEGTRDLLDAIEKHRAYLATSGELETKRRARVAAEIDAAARREIHSRMERAHGDPRFDDAIDRVLRRETTPAAAGRDLARAVLMLDV